MDVVPASSLGVHIFLVAFDPSPVSATTVLTPTALSVVLYWQNCGLLLRTHLTIQSTKAADCEDRKTRRWCGTSLRWDETTVRCKKTMDRSAGQSVGVTGQPADGRCQNNWSGVQDSWVIGKGAAGREGRAGQQVGQLWVWQNNWQAGQPDRQPAGWLLRWLAGWTAG